MARSCTFLIRLALCAPATMLCPRAQGWDLTLADLQQAAKQVERATAAFRVRCKGTEMHRDPEPMTLKIRYELLQDASGRVRCDVTRQLPWFRKEGSIINWHRCLSVWDGSRSTRLEATDRAGRPAALENFHSAVIASEATEAVQFQHPREYIDSYLLEPASALLAKEGTRIVGRVRRKLGEAIVIEAAQTQNDGYWTSRFHITPKLGFAVTYAAHLFRRSEADPWREYLIFEGMDYTQHANGVWLPRRVVTTRWNLWGDEPAYLAARKDLVLEWELDPAVDDSTFALRIPAGVTVRDKVNDKIYIQSADITDQMIADQVAAARRLAQEQGEKLASPGGARMLFAACAAVVLAGALIVYRIKRRRKATLLKAGQHEH